MNSKAGVAAVDRAFEILGAFRADRPILTLADIAKATGLYKSTILRLMGSLEKYGFVWQRADGTYQLGAGTLALAGVFQEAFDLRQYIEPVLEDLVREAGESASFFIRDGDHQVCLFRLDGRHAVRDYSLRLGDRRELNRSAASTILRTYDGAPFRTLPRGEVAVVSVGNVDPEMGAIGVPVFGSGHRLLGALTLSGPSMRFTADHVARLREIATDAAIRLSMSLGETRERFLAAGPA